MKIPVSNLEKITEALDAVNGNATAHTLSRYDVQTIAKKAEALLEKRGVRQKNRIGATVTYKPAGPAAKSYSYSAVSTTVTLLRGTREWFLTKVERSEVYPARKAQRSIIISAEARDDVIAHAMRDFTYTEASQEIADDTEVKRQIAHALAHRCDQYKLSEAA